MRSLWETNDWPVLWGVCLETPDVLKPHSTKRTILAILLTLLSPDLNMQEGQKERLKLLDATFLASVSCITCHSRGSAEFIIDLPNSHYAVNSFQKIPLVFSYSSFTYSSPQQGLFSMHTWEIKWWGLHDFISIIFPFYSLLKLPLQELLETKSSQLLNKFKGVKKLFW